MVLSASSVYSFRFYDDSYAIVEKQLLWVAIGLPCAWVATRLPLRWIRRLAWPGYAVSLTLLLLTAFLGVERNGNTNWLALGPIVIQPSEIAKLALILWAAHVYANKDRRLGSPHQIMIPVVPGLLHRHRPGRLRPRPRHRPGAVRDPARHALGGRRARPVLRLQHLRGQRAGDLPGHHQHRAARADHHLRRPVQGLPRHRLAARPRPLRAVQRRLVRPGHRRQPAEVGRPARGAHRLHLRRARRGARPGRHPAGDRAVPHHRLRRDPGRLDAPPTRSSATCPSASWSGCSAR